MTVQIDLSTVAPGFSDPVLDAQSAFRKILLAMSEPGTVVSLDHADGPSGLHPAAAAAALTLIDYDTPLWLSPGLRSDGLESWFRFHCGCPLVEAPGEAAFAILAEVDASTDLSAFDPGDPKYPDQSATLIVQLPSLDGGAPIALEGPGIPATRTIAPSGLEPAFWERRADAVAAFQLGIDIMLVSGAQLVGLPRTTRLAAHKSNGGA